jgi:tripartite-type tricarboxylate transporter receptor subunit TctC
MTMDRRGFLKGTLAVPMAGAFGSSAGAQAWPTRNITMIVAFPPGGQADLAARPVAQALEKILGKSVVVDNRAGAGGMLGNAAAARAEPDGHTLLMALSSMTFLPEAERLYDRKPSYELDQLVPIARVLADPGVLCVRSDSPYKSVADLVADAKKRPGQISFSSSGNYGAAHVPFEMFQQAAGIKLLHVPYRGGGPALLDLLSGQVDLSFPTLSAALPHAKSGALRVLAVTGTSRAPQLPDVPTMQEAGVKDFQFTQWLALLAPAGTPPAVVARLNAALRGALNSKDLREKFQAQAFESFITTPDEAGRFIASEAQRFAQLIKAKGITAN